MSWLSLEKWHRYQLVAFAVWLMALMAPSVPTYVSGVNTPDTVSAAASLTVAAAALTVVWGSVLGRRSFAWSLPACVVYGAAVRTLAGYVAFSIAGPAGPPLFSEAVSFLVAFVFNAVVLALLLALGYAAGWGLRWLIDQRTRRDGVRSASSPSAR
jgi:hypothetical protein